MVDLEVDFGQLHQEFERRFVFDGIDYSLVVEAKSEFRDHQKLFRDSVLFDEGVRVFGDHFVDHTTDFCVFVVDLGFYVRVVFLVVILLAVAVHASELHPVLLDVLLVKLAHDFFYLTNLVVL